MVRREEARSGVGGRPVSPAPPRRRMKRVAAAMIFAVAAGLPAAAAPPEPTAKVANIDRSGVLILVRSTLLALDHANKTGNYTVLRDLGSPQFQANTAARLSEIFAAQRRDALDLSGVAALDPQLTLLPQIESNGMLHMSGYFPSIPTQVTFDLAYAPVNGQWRLFGISVGLGQAAPSVPAAAAPNRKPPPAKPAGKLPTPAEPAN